MLAALGARCAGHARRYDTGRADAVGGVSSGHPESRRWRSVAGKFWFGRLEVRGRATHALAARCWSSELSTWCGARRPLSARAGVSAVPQSWRLPAWPAGVGAHPVPRAGGGDRAMADAWPARGRLAGAGRLEGERSWPPRSCRAHVGWSAGPGLGTAAAVARERIKVTLPGQARARRRSSTPKPAGARQVDACRLQSAAAAAPSNEPTVERKVFA